MLVKLRGGLVLGVDDNRKDRRVGPRGAKGGIRDERAAEPLPFARSRNGKSSDQAGRQQGIARKALRLLGRKLADLESSPRRRCNSRRSRRPALRRQSNC